MAKWQQIDLSFNIFPVKVLQGLDKAIDKVSKLVNILSKVMKILQMFMSSFSSFSAVLNTFINMAEQLLGKLSSDIGSAGIYLNVLVPPAFFSNLMNSPDLGKLSTGGFDGFLSRMRVSFYNTEDKHRPIFTSTSEVGGFIILSDNESLDDFYKAMQFITGFFSFMDLFPFNTSPPPPTNITTSSGFFPQADGTSKLGVKIEWDPPPIRGFTNYKIERSLVSGGTLVTKDAVPTKLVGAKGHEEEGIITALRLKLFGPDHAWPKVSVIEYKDASFKGGSHAVVPANPVSGGGSYIDYEVDPSESMNYYYVVSSGFTAMYGDPSHEVHAATTPTNCVDINASAVVEHEGGRVEYLSAGVGALGQWSAIQINAVLPFLDTILKIVDNFLESLKGSVKTNTQAFADFINGVVEKFNKYKEILETVVVAITALENFFSMAPKIAWLNVPIGPGGVDGFLTRVSTADKVPGGFSSRSGTTLGIVMVYGVGLNSPFGDSNGDVAALQTQAKAIGKAFSLLTKFIS